MKRKWLALAALIFLTNLSIRALAQKQQQRDLDSDEPTAQQQPHKDIELDDPAEEENLNRELWEFAKKTPYEQVQPYISQAQKASQATRSTEVALPNGWKIAPAGTQVEVGRLPYEAILYAGKLVVLDTGFYGKEGQEISIVDPKSSSVVKTLHFPSIFPSAKQGLEGDLYISGGFDKKIYRFNKEFNLARAYPVNGFAAGITPIDTKHLAVLYMVRENEKKIYGKGQLAILNTETGQIEREVTVGYFPYAVEYLNNKLYLTLTGENKLLVYDKELKPLKTLAAGKTPQTFCQDNSNLYIVNTTSDELSVVDTQRDAVVGKIEVRQKGFRSGSSPTSCVVEGNKLYVTQAEINAVAVFDKNKRQELGFIPTGWYPTKVLLNKGQMLVVSAKGIRPRRPNPQGPQPILEKGGEDYVLTLLKGAVSIIPKEEIASNLRKWRKQVEEGSPLYSPKQGMKLPIRHIFYIVKENRTYDQVLGDLGRGNGDPKLTLFGQDITPNHHKLAKDFVTLDNFYANGEISVLGHSFTTSGYASPFLEWLGNAKYSGRYDGYPFGTVPVTFSPTYLWNALEAKGVDYRIYGEPYYIFTRAYQLIVDTYGAQSELAQKFYNQMMVFAAQTDRGKEVSEFLKTHYGEADTPQDAVRLLEKPEFARFLSQTFTGDDSLAQAWQKDAAFRQKFAAFVYHFPLNYPSWDLKYSDLQRFLDWKTDFEKQVKSGRVAQLNYIWLPNDHTAGQQPGLPNPYQLVAQNDAALGRIVETISKSPIWRDSLILVVEDDAQNGPDHVDATRTVAFAAGPYVKRGVVVSDRYDQLSLLRTIELILGLDPLNQNDGLAVPMFGIFTPEPNNSGYIPPTPSSQLMESDQKLYKVLK
jgi:YVTN family beta-propeller protein